MKDVRKNSLTQHGTINVLGVLRLALSPSSLVLAQDDKCVMVSMTDNDVLMEAIE